MLALGFLLTVVTVAQSLRVASAPANAVNEQDPRYDPARVVNILGTVVEIHEVAYPGPLSGLHLAVKADAGTIDAYLGPLDFLKGFEVTFAKGDRIQVVGSKVKFRGSDVVLAREVSRDGTTLYLRDERGRPYWENLSEASAYFSFRSAVFQFQAVTNGSIMEGSDGGPSLKPISRIFIAAYPVVVR